MPGGRGSAAPIQDDVLITRALDGNATAWNELMRRHTHRVLVSLLAAGVPLDRAEDLAQEAWLRLIERQRTGRLDRMRLPGLVIAQARWLARDAARTGHRRTVLVGGSMQSLADSGAPEPVDPAADPAEQALHRERLEVIQAELARCPERARQVFEAVYGPGRGSAAEVAGDMGLSVQRVRQILCETRARMRRALAEQDEGGAP